MFRLCLELGIVHPDELRDRLDAQQIADWIAYERIEPFGMVFRELLHGIACAVAAAPYRKESAGAVEPSDYMPTHLNKQPEAMTWREIYDTMELITHGVDRRN